ncbi:beta-ketoacyl-ACP synthase III [Trichloromonas sp.]|uniref:beta-ketoacyl-ACP synthase III n=1 Tax=Trichloromonas sp. TaxID=3069249 RepID=UPI003D816736
MDVFITDLGAFLPNAPVSNEQMEEILGMVSQLPSRTRRIILRNNRISNRHYAIDPATGRTTHSNAQLTAEAIRQLHPYDGFTPADIECLACGTSSPDQTKPGHASMVHGELASAPCEVVSTAGVCVAGMTALKYAWLNVASGLVGNAVATGSELSSTYMRAALCGDLPTRDDVDLEAQPILAFEADFLRWMLSDGAGAAFLTSQRPTGRRALKIDWIELVSFAHQFETCMYSGALKNADGSLTGWREFTPEESARQHIMHVKQDVKLLNSEIIPTSVDRTLPKLIDKYSLRPEQITWFLPHYSSDFFRPQIYDHLKDIGFEIPYERWFSNLPTKGNTGSASIYIILEELLHSGRLKQGDRLLLFVPESGRFTISYAMLTVV